MKGSGMNDLQNQQEASKAILTCWNSLLDKWSSGIGVVGKKAGETDQREEWKWIQNFQVVSMLYAESFSKRTQHF